MTLERPLASPAFARRPADFGGFVHAESGRLVDGSGRELLLRGVGLGNWLLPEGYMWKFGPGAESPREIEALVERLIGPDAGADFWRRFRDVFVSESDVARIAESGFDHVRLPINSRIVQTDDGRPIEAGYELIDRVVEECRRHRLWVLLDLHGAPGGQTGTNIDDSPRGMPELFLDRRYRDNTLRLWRDLASRYAGDTTVLGYDLLNEPLPNEWQHSHADDLAALYRDLAAEIRAVDPDHLLVFEGAHWATNWSIFTEVWDENSLLQFHKYWSSPDAASIEPYLRARDGLGLPIYMGEGGENTLEWLYTAFRLYESHGIGWNFWPWKKVDTRTSPVSIVPPEGWEDVVAAAGGRSGLSRESAVRILDDYLSNAELANAVWQPEVVAAITGVAPAVVPAWGFGFRGSGVSYEARGGSSLPGIRGGDGVALEFANPGSNPANPFAQTDGRDYSDSELIVARLSAGDWLEFELEHAGVRGPIRAVDAHGSAVNVDIERSDRGIVVTAREPVTIARILFGAEEGTGR